MNIKYEVDTFEYKKVANLHNIYLRGTSDKWIMAHHDVCNHTIDNANDNSASVINAIGLKSIRPDINIALVDAEEPPIMGGGSGHFADRIKNGTLKAEWVLNFELTGSGGTNFFIGNYKTELTKKIQEKFNCAVLNPPFNDATVLINNANVNAALINPCPLKEGEIVVEQVGIANDVLNAKFDKEPKKKSNTFTSFFGFGNDKTEDKEEIDYDERGFDINGFDMDGYNIDGFHESELGSDFNDGFLEEYPSFTIEKSNIKNGDVLDKWELKSLKYLLKRSGYNPKNNSEKFKTKLVPIVLKPGEMPTINQLDTSILDRCHRSDDVVAHISPDEMKEFVEKVVTVICEL